jgi:hypothetical protein
VLDIRLKYGGMPAPIRLIHGSVWEASVLTERLS